MKKRSGITAVAIILVMGLVAITAMFSLNRNNNQDNASVETVSEVSWANSYKNLEELSDVADMIAVGEVKDVLGVTSDVVSEARWGPISLHFTDFSFSVDQVLKGPRAVSEILIHQTGAKGKDEISDDPLLEIGDKYVLFLHEYETGKYYILGGPQGRFQIINEHVFSMNNILTDKVFLTPGLDVKGIEKDSFIDSIIAILQTG
jgi:hypothetical protein